MTAKARRPSDVPSDETPKPTSEPSPPVEPNPSVDDAPTDEASGLRTYAVTAPHPVDLPGGREAVPGAQVELTETDAAPLVHDGHLVPIVSSLSDPTPETK